MCRECGIRREKRDAYFILVNLKERDHLVDLDVHGKMALKWVLKLWNGVDWNHWA